MVDVEATVNAFAWMLLGAACVGMLAWRIPDPGPAAAARGPAHLARRAGSAGLGRSTWRADDHPGPGAAARARRPLAPGGDGLRRGPVQPGHSGRHSAARGETCWSGPRRVGSWSGLIRESHVFDERRRPLAARSAVRPQPVPGQLAATGAAQLEGATDAGQHVDQDLTRSALLWSRRRARLLNARPCASG